MLHDGARPNSPAAASLSHPICHGRPSRHAFRPVAHRLPAYRRGAHGAVQLAFRQEERRQDAAAHRGHRPRALDRGRDPGDPRRPHLARHRLGRRRRAPVRPRLAPQGGRREPRRRRPRLSLLREPAGAGGDARGGESRGPAGALRRALARPRPGRGACRRQAGDPAQGAERGRDGRRGQGPGPGGVAEQGSRRPRAPALRRHADLHARRCRRRP